MKRLKSLLYTLFFAAPLLLNGCHKEKFLESGVISSDHYVQVYIEPNDFELRPVAGIENAIHAHFIGKSFECSSSDTKFYEYAKLFNDVSYKGNVLPFANKALTEPLTSVNIVCDKDFDATHKAGSSLGDVIMFCATSPYEFIQSGYKKKIYTYPDYWKMLAMNQNGIVKPIEILVKDVNKNNTRMLYPIFHLYFKKKPATSGEYLFTVTIKIKDVEMVKQIYYTF